MIYYSTHRPIAPGVLTSGAMALVKSIVNYDMPQYIDVLNRTAWGHIETDTALSERDISASDLTPHDKVMTEREKRLAAAHILAESGYTKKEAYQEAMRICIEEVEAIIS